MRLRGFTLIEILVVTAVLAVLIAVFVPALGVSRGQARSIVCASHIRQLLLELNAYDTENGAFPPGYDPEGRSTFVGSSGALIPPGRWWLDYSHRVAHGREDGREVLMCPSKRQDQPILAVNLLCGNYGVNISVCRGRSYMRPYGDGFNGKPLSHLQVPRPGETLLLVDSGYTLVNWWHVTESPPVALPAPSMLGGVQHSAYVPGMEINSKKVILPGQTSDAIDGRHPHRTVNAGFVDGHVSQMDADRLLVEKTVEGRWNNSPLWQPARDPIIPPADTP